MSRNRTLHELAPTAQESDDAARVDGSRPLVVGFVDEGAPDRAMTEKDQKIAGVEMTDLAAYMIDMLQELRALATRSGMTTLGHVIEIAEKEARAMRVSGK